MCSFGLEQHVWFSNGQSSLIELAAGISGIRSPPLATINDRIANHQVLLVGGTILRLHGDVAQPNKNIMSAWQRRVVTAKSEPGGPIANMRCVQCQFAILQDLSIALDRSIR